MKYLCVIALICLTSKLHAQALVRSGEHDAFSRLVVYVPDSQNWRLLRSSSGYRLTLDDWVQGFDTAAVFERMPRTRVSDVRARESALEIDLTCECVAIVERIQGVGLIVDISEIAATEAPATEEASSEEDRSPPARLNILRDAPSLDLAQLPEKESVNPALDAFRKSLFEGLGRSASLSLVDVEEFERDISDGASQLNPTIDLADTLDDGRVRVTTALEDAIGSNGGRSDPDDQKECPSPTSFAIHDWGGSIEFGAQVSKLRRELLGEFDEVNTKKLRELARLYLYFGLGSEARLLMKQFEIPKKEQDLVLALAHILDPELFGSNDMLADVSGCGPQVSPWAVLARADGDAVIESEAVETVSQFSRWPRHLQEHLGPQLISILSSSGQVESVEIVKNLLSRQGEELPQAAELAVEKYSAPTTESLATLLEIALSGSDQSATALALFLERSLQQGAAFDDELIELASAYAEEVKGTETSWELTNLMIEALVAKGQVSDAIDAFIRATRVGWVPDQFLGDSLVEQSLRLENRAKIAQLSVFLLDNQEELPVSSENQARLSEALLDMGLPDLARRIYQTQLSAETASMLEAELAIASGATEQAIELLDSFEGSDADRRRTDILLRSGRALEAWETRNPEVPNQQVSRLAWFAQQWDSVDNAGAQGKVASLIVKELESDPETAPLTSAKELSQDSVNTRMAIRELLDSDSF